MMRTVLFLVLFVFQPDSCKGEKWWPEKILSKQQLKILLRFMVKQGALLKLIHN